MFLMMWEIVVSGLEGKGGARGEEATCQES